MNDQNEPFDGKEYPRGGKSKGKRPRVGISLAYSRNRRKPSVLRGSK